MADRVLISAAETQALIAAGGSGITQLTGDVTAGPGSGSVAATVARVNGVTPGATGLALLDDATAPAARATIAALTAHVSGTVPTALVGVLAPVRSPFIRGCHANHNAQLDWFGMAAGTATGTGSNTSDATKNWDTLTSNGALNGGFGVRSPTSGYCRSAHRPWLQGRCKPAADITHTRFWFGLTGNQVIAGSHKTSLPADSVWLTCDVEGGDANLILRCQSATTQSADLDTGVAYVASHEYVLTLSIESTTTVLWQIEDVTAATTTAGLATPSTMPTSTVGLFFYMQGFALEAVAKAIAVNALFLGGPPY